MSKDFLKLLKQEIDILNTNDQHGVNLIFQIKSALGIGLEYFPQMILIDKSKTQSSENKYKLDYEGVCFGLVYDYTRYYTKNPNRDNSYMMKLRNKYNNLNERFVERIQLYQSQFRALYIPNKIDITNESAADKIISQLNEGTILALRFKEHIICIRPVKAGFKVFDPNFGEFDCGSKEAKVNLQNLFKVIEYLKKEYKSDIISIANLSAGIKDINIAQKGKQKLGDNNYFLQYAILNNNIKALEYLIKAGANVNAKEENGYTALVFAASQGEVKIINTLINAGADLNTKDPYGRTALAYAVDFQHYDAAKFLIKAGADVNIGDEKGLTPLMHAAVNADPEMLELLIKHGGDINALDKAGKKALELIKNTKEHKKIRVLLQLFKYQKYHPPHAAQQQPPPHESDNPHADKNPPHLR